MVVDLARLFLFRAEESLAGADSEFDNGRYNNCANRSYYACFQAAICALMRAGIGTSGRSGQWGHGYVQAQFVGQLVNRRKLYPTSLREVLTRNLELRLVADYRRDEVSATQARRALHRARNLVAAVQSTGW